MNKRALFGASSQHCSRLLRAVVTTDQAQTQLLLQKAPTPPPRLVKV